MNNKGFTLVEILIVLSALAILLTITYPSLAAFADSSRENEKKVHLEAVNKAVVQYYAFKGKYPEGTRQQVLDSLRKETGIKFYEDKYNYFYNPDTHIITIS